MGAPSSHDRRFVGDCRVRRRFDRCRGVRSLFDARACAGIGGAFATIATTAMVNRAGGRGRAISSLLMAESLGLLGGSAIGGSLYGQSGPASPFVAGAAWPEVAGAGYAECYTAPETYWIDLR